MGGRGKKEEEESPFIHHRWKLLQRKERKGSQPGGEVCQKSVLEG